jgi:toxin-antitoxin system PIN domain toxin
MILTDANLLLYAYNADAAEHADARRWLEGQLSAPDLFCFSWQTITAFLRISTNARAFAHPFTIAEAAATVTEWLERPQSVILVPGERHWDIFTNLLTTGQATGPLVMDAHLAALAVEHGCQLATTDRDFARFPGLQTINPLLPQ